MQRKKNKNTNFFDRIHQIIDFYGIKNVNDFALNYLNYKSSQKINRLKEENTAPSFEILSDISNKFDEIDANWLLTGEGDMLKHNTTSNSQTIQGNNNTQVGNGNRNMTIDNRLSNDNATIQALEKQIAELEARLKEKDNFIKMLLDSKMK